MKAKFTVWVSFHIFYHPSLRYHYQLLQITINKVVYKTPKNAETASFLLNYQDYQKLSPKNSAYQNGYAISRINTKDEFFFLPHSKFLPSSFDPNLLLMRFYSLYMHIFFHK